MRDTIYDDARRYDAVHGSLASGPELDFYLAEAQAAGGAVLELGTGTGRLAIPLAAAGLAVTGLDLSAAMLAYAQEKAKDADVSVAWVEGDARSVDLGRRFGLVFLPINSLAHFPEREDLEALLATVRRHLAPGGRFVFHIFNPCLKLLARDPAARFPYDDVVDPRDGTVATWTEAVDYDRATQLNHLRWFFRTSAGETQETLQMRIFFPRELELLLHYNGWDMVARYGDFRREAFASASPHQVIVAQPR